MHRIIASTWVNPRQLLPQDEGQSGSEGQSDDSGDAHDHAEDEGDAERARLLLKLETIIQMLSPSQSEWCS